MSLTIEITAKGTVAILKAEQQGGILPNAFHILSSLSKTKSGMQSIKDFERFGYADPTLSECVSILHNEGLINVYE